MTAKEALGRIADGTATFDADRAELERLDNEAAAELRLRLASRPRSDRDIVCIRLDAATGMPECSRCEDCPTLSPDFAVAARAELVVAVGCDAGARIEEETEKVRAAVPGSALHMAYARWARSLGEQAYADEVFRGAWLREIAFRAQEGVAWSLWLAGPVYRKDRE